MNAPIPQGIADRFQMLPVAEIRPSTTATQERRRKRFDQAALAALTRDVQEKGVIEPILVIPTRQDIDAGYEIVAGERRWLATKAAGLSHVPAIVTNITRDELVAFQVVENKLREALHPLDEAEALRELMVDGMSAEAAGAKIGLRRSQAYNRLKLLELSPEVLDAIESGRLDASKALCIARVPGPKLQKKALKLALEPGWKGQPLSERELDEAIRNKFFVRLDAVPFDTGDDTLDPLRGACTQCHDCSLNDPELHAELQATAGVGAFICMDKPCHDNKVVLHFARRVDRARQNGLRVIEGAEAKDYWQSGRGFTRLDTQCYDVEYEGNEAPTYRDLLGQAPEATVVIVDPKNGQPHDALPDAELVAALKAKGIDLKDDDIPFTDRDAETAEAARARMDKEREKEEARKALERAYRTRLLRLVHDKFKGPLKKGHLQLIVDRVLDANNGAPEAVQALYGGEEPAFEKMTEQDLARYALELTLGECVDWIGNAPQRLLDVAGSLKIDAAKVRKQVKAELEPKEKPARKKTTDKKAKKK